MDTSARVLSPFRPVRANMRSFLPPTNGPSIFASQNTVLSSKAPTPRDDSLPQLVAYERPFATQKPLPVASNPAAVDIDEIGALPKHAIVRDVDGSQLTIHQQTYVSSLKPRPKDGSSTRGFGFGSDRSTGPDVADEFATSANCCIGREALAKDYGHGVFIYFEYVKVLSLLSFLCCALVFAPFGLNYSHVRDRLTLASGMIALYQPRREVQAAWIGTTVSCVVLALLFSVAWRFYRISLVSRWKGEGRLEEAEDGTGTDRIQDAQAKLLTRKERACRRGISVTIFFLLVGAQAVVTYYLHESLAASDAAVLGFAVSAALSVINMVERQVAKVLSTSLEGHDTITALREWDCAKAFALKISNVLVVYLVQALTVGARRAAQAAAAAAEGRSRAADRGVSSAGVLLMSCLTDAQLDAGRVLMGLERWNATGGGGGPGGGMGPPPPGPPSAMREPVTAEVASFLALRGASCSCPLVSMGWTFFFMIVTDIAFCTLVDAVVNTAAYRAFKARSSQMALSDEEMRPEFDTADKYVQAWNRTFLMLLGCPVFPMIAPIALGGFLLQYWYDRWSLTRLCRKPLYKEEPISLRLANTCAAIVALAAVVTYPNGMAFIFARRGEGMADCHFFRGL